MIERAQLIEFRPSAPNLESREALNLIVDVFDQLKGSTWLQMSNEMNLEYEFPDTGVWTWTEVTDLPQNLQSFCDDRAAKPMKSRSWYEI